MKAAAFVVLAFGLMFVVAGLGHGLTDVRLPGGTSCGSAFAVDNSVEDDAFADSPDTTRETCDADRADVLHLSLGLLLGGVVGVVLGVVGFSVAKSEDGARQRSAPTSAVDGPQD